MILFLFTLLIALIKVTSAHFLFLIAVTRSTFTFSIRNGKIQKKADRRYKWTKDLPNDVSLIYLIQNMGVSADCKFRLWFHIKINPLKNKNCDIFHHMFVSDFKGYRSSFNGTYSKCTCVGLFLCLFIWYLIFKYFNVLVSQIAGYWWKYFNNIIVFPDLFIRKSLDY